MNLTSFDQLTRLLEFADLTDPICAAKYVQKILKCSEYMIAKDIPSKQKLHVYSDNVEIFDKRISPELVFSNTRDKKIYITTFHFYYIQNDIDFIQVNSLDIDFTNSRTSLFIFKPDDYKFIELFSQFGIEEMKVIFKQMKLQNKTSEEFYYDKRGSYKGKKYGF